MMALIPGRTKRQRLAKAVRSTTGSQSQQAIGIPAWLHRERLAGGCLRLYTCTVEVHGPGAVVAVVAVTHLQRHVLLMQPASHRDLAESKGRCRRGEKKHAAKQCGPQRHMNASPTPESTGGLPSRGRGRDFGTIRDKEGTDRKAGRRWRVGALHDGSTSSPCASIFASMHIHTGTPLVIW